MQACLSLGSFGRTYKHLSRPLLMLQVATTHTTISVDFNASKLLRLSEKATICSN